MGGGAVIRGNYRYLLWREWDSQGKTVSFIMLNPSRADAEVNDPTITRCINFAKLWVYGRLEVVNLFAIVLPNHHYSSKRQNRLARITIALF